jgi:hypothetical protein
VRGFDKNSVTVAYQRKDKTILVEIVCAYVLCDLRLHFHNGIAITIIITNTITHHHSPSPSTSITVTTTHHHHQFATTAPPLSLLSRVRVFFFVSE